MSSYEGPVVFVQGVHYPAVEDGWDEARPLRVNQDGSYRDAEADEALHNDVHHLNELELEVGGEG